MADRSYHITLPHSCLTVVQQLEHKTSGLTSRFCRTETNACDLSLKICPPFTPTGTSFDSGAISNGFNTIDSGLYDNALISGQVDAGVKSGLYDASVKSGQYQTTLQSSQFGGSLASGQFDTGVKSAQYGASLKSGQYDTGARSGHYDLSYKSAQYGSGVRAGQYDTLDGVLPAFTWSTTTLPSSSTTVVAGNTSTYTYQASTNNAAGGSSPVSLTLPSSLSGERGFLLAARLVFATCT